MRATESHHSAATGGSPAAGGAESIRRTVAEMIAPLVRLREELVAYWDLQLDVDGARARLEAGAAAFEPMKVLAAAGNLRAPYQRATVALERAGLATEPEANEARERAGQVMRIVMSWLGGEPPPRDGARATARQAAALVGGSALRCAIAQLRGAPPQERAQRVASLLEGWERPSCPCCGGAPEFALRQGELRVLVCSRCDSSWRTSALGCLGCGAVETPTLARIHSPAIGFQLAICNSCGRYMKEPLDRSAIDPLVDRALTAELDAAAEARGLRL